MASESPLFYNPMGLGSSGCQSSGFPQKTPRCPDPYEVTRLEPRKLLPYRVPQVPQLLQPDNHMDDFLCLSGVLLCSRGELRPHLTPMTASVPLCYSPCLMGTGFQFPLYCAWLTHSPRSSFHPFLCSQSRCVAGGDSRAVHGPGTL